MSGVEPSLLEGSVDPCWTLSRGPLVTDPTSTLPMAGLVLEPWELALRTGKKGLVSEVMTMLEIRPMVPSDESPAYRCQTEGEMRTADIKC
jgi:hypothetical protein